MDIALFKEISKWSTGTIAVVGLIWVLHTAVKGDDEQAKFLRDHMGRQTAALERLVEIYSGD